MKQIDRKTDGIHGLIALRLMLMVLLSVSAIAPMIAQQALVLKDSVGNGEGIGDGEFVFAQGVATLLDGSVLVADRDNDRIQKFDKDGNYISQFGSNGTGDGEFDRPTGIAIDSEDNIFVTDRFNNRVQKFDKDGNFIKVIGTTTASSDDGDFSNPIGIAIDAADYVYVTDFINYRVQKLTNDGEFVRVIGGAGDGDGLFNGPYGIAADSDANIYVADSGNDNIQKFDSTGVFISSFGSIGTGDGQFTSPHGVALDPQGNIYISDNSNHNIQIFANDGTFISQFTPDLAKVIENVDFIHFDRNGDLLISNVSYEIIYRFSTVQEINLLQGATEVASEGTVDFDSVVIGASSSLEFTIENLGGIDLAFSGTTGSQVALSGDHAADFSVTQTEVGDGLEGFSSVSFTVTYTPATLGSNTATLTINSNDEDEGTYTVDLTGIAVAADNGDDNEDDNPLSTANENKIGIYPNPAVEVVSIADASVKYAVVYNLMGAKVYAAELENGTLNVKSLRKGLYVLTLMDGVGDILSTNRLMKE